MDYARLPWRPAGRRRVGSSGGGVIKRCCLSDQESKGAYRYPDGDIRQPLHLISGGGRYGDPKLVGPCHLRGAHKYKSSVSVGSFVRTEERLAIQNGWR